MIFREFDETIGTDREVYAGNGNWVSRRILLEEDGMGFSFHLTTIYAATQTRIHYKHHLESVYCIKGRGEVEIIATGEIFKITPGSLYALDENDEHYLRAFEDLELACVFNPALVGSETHQPDGSYALPVE
jgi:L-ectoine synthase